MGKVTALRRPAAFEPAIIRPARPFPPNALIDHDGPGMAFAPAPEVKAWIDAHLLQADSPLYNPDHAHWGSIDWEVLWASQTAAKAGRTVLGTCEQVAFRAGGWAKARQEAQMLAWFGRVPKYLVTLAADFCASCSDTYLLALVEHELYHVRQTRNEFGEPEFDRDGNPKVKLVAHDVEEFHGVVRRYGAGPDVAELVRLAQAGPEVEAVHIAAACGTCLERAA